MKSHTIVSSMGQCCLSQIFYILIWWRHGGHLKHFIYRTLTAVIFVRFVQIWTRCFHPVFAIENQQNRLVTSGFITNRAYFFVHFLAQKGRHNQNVFFFILHILLLPWKYSRENLRRGSRCPLAATLGPAPQVFARYLYEPAITNSLPKWCRDLYSPCLVSNTH